MSEEIGALYGYAAYQVEFWTKKRDLLLVQLQSAASLAATAHQPAEESIPAPDVQPPTSEISVSTHMSQVALQKRISGVFHGGRYYGIFTRVAKLLGVNEYLVSRVFWGYTADSSISAAINADMVAADARVAAAIQEELALGAPPNRLSQSELDEFLFGGKYYRLMSATARLLDCTPKSMRDIATGRKRNRVFLAKLRAAMASRDAELATKTTVSA